MRKMTGKEFTNLITENPSFCKNIDENIEVTTFVDLTYSNITHLSHLLTFSGRNENGWVANFNGCRNLKIATGTFNGFIYFISSSIEKIENLIVTETENTGRSANFSLCKNLKVATGIFHGYVDFSNSGVETIKDLNIKHKNQNRHKAYFLLCPIKYVPKEYRARSFAFEEGVIKNSIKKDEINKEINKIKSETNNIII